MQINNVDIPEPGTTTQYIPDTIGGWLYEITTTITVKQHTLQSVQEKLDEARAQAQAAQSILDELQPQAEALATAIALNPPIKESATSTKDIINP